MSTEEVRQHLIDAGLGKRLIFDANVGDRTLEANTERTVVQPATPYTLDRECNMLTAFARRVVNILDRRATGVRSHHILCFTEGQVDWTPEAMQSDRTQAEVCRLLGSMGASALVRPADREQLKAKGLLEDEIGIIDVTTRRYAMVEDRGDWLIGPRRDVLLHHLDAAGIAPTDHHVRQLRASALWMMADLLEMTADRYVVVPKHVTDIAIKVLKEAGCPRTASWAQQTVAVQELLAPRKPDNPTPQAAQEDQASSVHVVDTRRPASFVALVTDLVRSKCSPKVRNWTNKTARQHLSIARLFVKSAGTDDPRYMTQADVGGYLSLLARLPTHWGKSADDVDRSLNEILARVDELKKEQIGLSPPTINRHRIQLSTILDHMASNGYPIGIVSKSSRAKDLQSPGEKRRAFTAEEGRTLVTGSPWTSSNAHADDSQSSGPPRTAQFWVFLVNWYMLMRLSEACGLMVNDIDFFNRTITIRNNLLRRIKNTRANRQIPVPQELVRLGLLTFAHRQKELGHAALFPELHGFSTEPAVLFAKKWNQALDKSLPEARTQRKTMHSTRKGGNSAMMDAGVIDQVRYYILGHALKDVHGRHYTEPPSKQQMIVALKHIPVITSTLQRYDSAW